MKYLGSICILIFLSSCAGTNKFLYPGGKESARRSVSSSVAPASCNEMEKIKDSLYKRSFIQLQIALKDCDLSDQNDLYHALTRVRAPSPQLLDMAEFIFKRGDIPKELDEVSSSEEEKKKDMNLSFLDLKGPLQRSISSGNLTLTRFFLGKMNPEDIAKGSLGFRAILPSLEINPTQEMALIDYFQNAAFIYGSVNEAISVNEEKCRQKLELNCQAVKNLRQELALMHEGVREISRKQACMAQMNYKDSRELMDEQIKLGARTSNAAPKTYDAHAQEAQTYRRKVSMYKNIFFAETGRYPDLSRCE